jgi:hypothetical protein
MESFTKGLRDIGRNTGEGEKGENRKEDEDHSTFLTPTLVSRDQL